MDRRTYLSLLGASAVALGSPCLSRQPEPSNLAPAPSGQDGEREWTLEFEDVFERSTLATEWEVGWGWGRRTTTSPTVISPENVELADSTLRLRGTHTGDSIRSGAVNTRDTVTFGPGSYLEASIRFADRSGFLNAFWSKPNSGDWPPEIDVVELWQESNSRRDTHRSRHNLHYPTSATPGDDVTHRNEGDIRNHDQDLTAQFHDYGLAWLPDRVVHFVDQRPVTEWTTPSMLAAMGAGAPFYVMLSLNIDRFGQADFSESWGETMDVDHVRLWNLDRDPTGGETHYLWVRSATGEMTTFTFRATGGNVEFDVPQNDVNYWITDDQTIAGGAVSATESLPGFRYDGELAEFTYSGPLDVFVDDERVDPDSLSEPAD